jgi:hypothetical protein
MDPEAVAAELDIELDEIGICHACLSFVSFPLGDGDERRARREARRIAPDLWREGLALPAKRALRRARDRGVAGAREACVEAETAGGRSAIACAIVMRLAAIQAERAKGDVLKMGFQPWPPPDWN